MHAWLRAKSVEPETCTFKKPAENTPIRSLFAGRHVLTSRGVEVFMMSKVLLLSNLHSLLFLPLSPLECKFQNKRGTVHHASWPYKQLSTEIQGKSRLFMKTFLTCIVRHLFYAWNSLCQRRRFRALAFAIIVVNSLLGDLHKYKRNLSSIDVSRNDLP